MSDHQPVLRHVDGVILLSCQCTLTPTPPGVIREWSGAGRPTFTFWGEVRDWPDTVALFNSSEHHGAFTDRDRLGRGRLGRVPA